MSTGLTTIVAFSLSARCYYQTRAVPRLAQASIDKQKGGQIDEKNMTTKPKVVRPVGGSTPREPISLAGYKPNGNKKTWQATTKAHRLP